jgi:hypothetical protein
MFSPIDRHRKPPRPAYSRVGVVSLLRVVGFCAAACKPETRHLSVQGRSDGMSRGWAGCRESAGYLSRVLARACTKPIHGGDAGALHAPGSNIIPFPRTRTQLPETPERTPGEQSRTLLRTHVTSGLPRLWVEGRIPFAAPDLSKDPTVNRPATAGLVVRYPCLLQQRPRPMPFRLVSDFGGAARAPLSHASSSGLEPGHEPSSARAVWLSFSLPCPADVPQCRSTIVCWSLGRFEMADHAAAASGRRVP